MATLLTRRVRSQGAQPLVTQVGDAGRTELSAITLMNAAAKIGNALLEEFDLVPGDAIGLALPPHWQRSCWLAGAWIAGMAVDVADDPTQLSGAGLSLIVAGPREAEALESASSPVAVISLHPLGLPEAVPDGCLDATSLTRMQPDSFLHSPATDTQIAMLPSGLDQRQVLQEADALGDRWGLAPGGRLLVDPGAVGPLPWLAMLAVPLVRDAAVVLGAPGIAEQERVTAWASTD